MDIRTAGERLYEWAHGSAMLRTYSYNQLEAKRAAIQALLSRPQFVPSEEVAEGAYVTRHATKSAETCDAESIRPEVIENADRPVGTRTQDLYRVKVENSFFSTSPIGTTSLPRPFFGAKSSTFTPASLRRS